MLPTKTIVHLSLCALILTPLACGKKKSSSSNPANLPVLKPSVVAATPSGLQTASLALDTTAGDFKTRFFTTGPTNILGILKTIDDRLTGLNTQTASDNATCVTQSPVAYTINPFGQSVTMYAQCYQILGTPTATVPKLIQFGTNAGITYIYVALDAERIAAIATPIVGQTDRYQVQAWIGLGYTSSGSITSAGSYGVMQLTADPSSSAFELAVAGTGFGYCGAQLKSDGTNIYATGSADQGSTCLAISSACVAKDASTAATCTTAQQTFKLPALGRKAISTSLAASLYPATPTITLNATTSDDLYFGPSTPTPGVGDIGLAATTP